MITDWELEEKALLEAARAAKGFMPDDEGLALAGLAELCAARGDASIVEIGAYCGRSALYLASGIARARAKGAPAGTIVLSVDHHHGSEENQVGWEHHDASLVDSRTGRLDTLPTFRANIENAGAEEIVVAVVGDSKIVAAHWPGQAALVFIDGGHGEGPAWTDYRAWEPKVAVGGFLAIHDVFADPRDGGRPPYELYCRALDSGSFLESAELSCASLRVLHRVVAHSV